MSTVRIGELTASISCPKCQSTEFETANGKDDDIVTCKKCGFEAGTLKDVRAKQRAAIEKEAPKVAKKALQDALKGVKGFKRR